MEIESRYSGRIPIQSAFQMVEMYLRGSVRHGEELPRSAAAGVAIIGLGSQDKVGIVLNDVALCEPGMPLHEWKGQPMLPGETVTVTSSPPFTELAICGNAATVHGDRGDMVHHWLDCLMEVLLTCTQPGLDLDKVWSVCSMHSHLIDAAAPPAL